MSGQLLAVGLIVAAAGLYLARAAWRSLAGRSCGSGCGKCAGPATEPEKPGRIRLV